MLKNTKNKTEKKTLGPSKYKNSKRKNKPKIKTIDKNQILLNNKNRTLKAKIKHLQKEQKRIEVAIKNNSTDQKSLNQKISLEEKIRKLMQTLEKYTK